MSANEIHQVDSVSISIASPVRILEQSNGKKGEVMSDKTLLHKSMIPHDFGLFCARIFGPVKDWECNCGKYNGIKHPEFRGTICDQCGVEVASKDVRRERMGHIELAAPVTHIWFLKEMPSVIGLLLDMSVKKLERVIYFKGYMVMNPGKTPFKPNQVLPIALEDEEDRKEGSVCFREALEKYATDDKFDCKIGAEAVQEALTCLDLPKEIADLQKAKNETRDKQILRKLDQRLRLFQAFHDKKVRPEWMVLSVLPVLPPGLRPLIQLPRWEKLESVIEYGDVDQWTIELRGSEKVVSIRETRSPELKKAHEDLHRLFPKDYPKSKTASEWLGVSDINELYGRVIRQNNRLKAILANQPGKASVEKRKLQEAVDALLGGENSGVDPINKTKENLESMARDIESIDESGPQAKLGLQKAVGKLIAIRGKSAVLSPDQSNSLQLQYGRLKQTVVNIPGEKASLEMLVAEILESCDKGPGRHKKKENQFESLSDNLKGKDGFFRQSILGKRVDYSGRAVIVVGPELKLHQCGLPKKMAMVLFEPFIVRRLKAWDRSLDNRGAQKIFEERGPVVWDALQEVAKEHPVLLNRAPTLHRLSIQAFEPVLIEEEAIRLHPLVCAGFGADFDGDTMAVHVPLSKEAQEEARELMMATQNFLHPANGTPAMNPSQDVVLGCYYLTAEPRKLMPSDPSTLPLFGSKEEAIFAFEDHALKTHDWIRLANPDFGRATVFGDAGKKRIVTTVGRILFNEIWPAELGFYNNPANKKRITEMVFECYQTCGRAQAIVTLDRLKEIGFREATRAGISIGMDDLIIPQEVLDKKIPEAQSKTALLESKPCNDPIAKEERLKEIKGVWDHCNDEVSKKMMTPLEANQGKSEYNPVWIMVESGARGNKEQVRQLVGLRGLMAKPGGGYDKRPVLTNFRDALSVADYSVSCHGVRKGVSDRSIQTADAGYLTRKLVSAAQEVVVGEGDCGTQQGVWVQAITDDGRAAEQDSASEVPIVSLVDRITGRVACGAVLHPDDNGKVLIPAGQIITADQARTVCAAGVKSVKIRSPITCESRYGICMTCYGESMTLGKRVPLGEAVGVIAAQSIGERGTQLTMRTFHTGGTASGGDITSGLNRVTELFEARSPKDAAVMSRIDGSVTSITDKGSAQCLVIKDANTGEDEKHYVPDGKGLCVKEGDLVTKGQLLSKGPVDPNEILDVCGLQGFQDYMIREVQKIYPPGSINCKHIEVIIRQMLLAKVRVTEPGDTIFNRNEEVEREEFAAENRRVSALGQQTAKDQPMLLGITQAALQAEGFLSAASFQNTTKILAQAAVHSKRDPLPGLKLGIKGSVMAGKLIPAGTGFPTNQNTGRGR